MWTSEEALFLNAAGEVVGAKDPSKLTLLVRAGGSIPVEEAKRYGLIQPRELAEGEMLEEAPLPAGVTVEPEGEKAEESAADKAEQPTTDKAEKPARNKAKGK